MKIRDVIKLLEEHGWRLERTRVAISNIDTPIDPELSQCRDIREMMFHLERSTASKSKQV